MEYAVNCVIFPFRISVNPIYSNDSKKQDLMYLLFNFGFELFPFISGFNVLLQKSIYVDTSGTLCMYTY